ncbi:hypothetical protein [Paenibacillus puerhi]|uniref:hypothetical protein n=1 Tax=Paenibacillus puerhi TaxID=2692622 RepID=UPI001357EB68|nr:hypothetical protein [Paenibacillus puerhi]
MSTKEVITIFEKAIKNEAYLSDEDMKKVATYYKKHLSQYENEVDGTDKELIQQMILRAC